MVERNHDGVRVGSSTRRPQPANAAGIWLCALLVAAGCDLPDTRHDPIAQSADPRLDSGDELVLERPIEIPAEAGAVHTYSIAADPGRFSRLLIDARGNEIRVEARNAAAELIRATPGNGHTWGLETITLPNGPGTGREAELSLALTVVQATGSTRARIQLLSVRADAEDREQIEAAEDLLVTARRNRGGTLDADREARRKAEESAEKFAAVSDPLGEAIAALEVASICIEALDGDCVWEWARRALANGEDLDAPRIVEQALAQYGLGEMLKGNFAAAEGLLDRTISRFGESTTVRHQARAQIFLSAWHDIQVSKGRSRDERRSSIEARRLAGERARELFREAGDRLGEAEAYVTLGGYSRRNGEILDSRKHYKRAEEIMRDAVASPRAATVLYNNLGVHYRSLGDHQRALEAYTAAMEIYEATGFGPGTNIYSNLGRLNRILGDHAAAIECHQRALEGAPAMAAVDLGHIYLELGRTEQALESFRLALDKSRGSREQLAWALDGEGLTLLALGDYGAAADSLRRALEIYRESGVPQSQANTLRSLALVTWRAGDAHAAAAMLDEARRFTTDIGDLFLTAKVDALSAAIKHSTGDLEGALEDFEHATENYETLRADLGDLDRRADFFASRQDHYLDFIALLADLERTSPGAGYAARAYGVSERARARSLVDWLRRSRWESAVQPDSELIDRLRQIGARVEWLRDEIENAVAAEVPDRRRLVELRSVVESELIARADLWDRIRRELPRYAELRSPSPLPLGRIQELLSPSAALLQFALGEKESYLFVVTDKQIALHVLPAGRDSIQQMCRSFYRSATTRRKDPSAVEGDAKRLYSQLIAPAEGTLVDRAAWIIVPDGALYNLPFEALAVETSSQGTQYLVERVAIQYVPSATTLVTLQNPRDSTSSPRGLTAFADSLPEVRPLRGARAEVEEIARIMAGTDEPVSRYLGDEASEEYVKTSASVRTSRFLHFATHGDFDAADPSASGLVLAASGREDGRLTSVEVLDLELNADLVVLSGCQTGLGKELRGEGIVGLTRAFMYAGAQSVVVSLWRVEDRSTSQLMVAFYEALGNGRNKAEAIREAKVRLVRSEEWSHPFFWAPFVLVGGA